MLEPSALVDCARVSPAVLLMATFAPGITAPLASLTVTASAPVDDVCALKKGAQQIAAATEKIKAIHRGNTKFGDCDRVLFMANLFPPQLRRQLLRLHLG